MNSHKILLIKTSSLGDIIHMLPALTDAAKAFPNLEVDWVVEKSFQTIPSMHPNVQQVIPISLRQWRKNLFSLQTWKDLFQFIKTIRKKKYDIIIDAQGLMKSAWVTLFAKGLTVGLDAKSARESFASIFYQKHVTVNFQQHAVVRMRELFAKALGYSILNLPAVGLNQSDFKRPEKAPKSYIIFLHGTTWFNKKWPVEYWQALARRLDQATLDIFLPWSNPEEENDAKSIQQRLEHVHILPRQSLPEMAEWIAHATAIVSVDTGLGHLAAAFGTPTVSLYGPTNPAFTGTLGENQIHLSADFPCAPCLQKKCAYTGEIKPFPACFTTISPDKVWDVLKPYLPYEKS